MPPEYHIETYLLHTIGNQLITKTSILEMNNTYNSSYEYYGNYTCHVILSNDRELNGTTVYQNQQGMYFAFSKLWKDSNENDYNKYANFFIIERRFQCAIVRTNSYFNLAQ